MKNNYLIIVFSILIRKVYFNKVKGRNIASNNLRLMMIIINIFTFLLLLEWLLPIKGFIYLSHTKILPMAPTAMLVFGILYGAIYLFFPPKKYNAEKIGIIRKAFDKANAITRSYVITYLIVSVIIFFVSMMLVFPKYN